MDNIEAVCDAQGFYVGGRFYPREMAFLSLDGSFRYYTFDLGEIFPTRKDQKTATYCQRYIHHIPWDLRDFEVSALPVHLFGELLQSLVRMWCKTGFLGVRNSHLRIECEKLAIPVFNMEKIKVERHFLDSCKLHAIRSHCCISKVNNLYKTIKVKQN